MELKEIQLLISSLERSAEKAHITAQQALFLVADWIEDNLEVTRESQAKAYKAEFERLTLGYVRTDGSKTTNNPL